MLFSYRELSRLVDLSKTDPKTLRNRLTFAGFEVENLTKPAYATKLVIGEVLSCEKHPDSDHLHVLKVDCGGKFGILDIVCGAPNVRKGLKVIVALPGCELPALNETIKAGKIRGKDSNGMCCSLLELGVNKESLPSDSPSLNGIEELPSDAPVGETNVLGYLDLDDDIFDINILANRPDCLSYVGMAREISSLTGYALRPIPSFDQVKTKESNLTVETKSEKCPRFSMLEIRNIVPKKKTPQDIVRVLEIHGIRSLSPMVDLGNYVMLVSGEPFNLYDADKNPTRHYEVRDDYQGEFVSFDGKKHELIPNDLVISDGKKVLCLGGIMAGENAEVTSETKNLDVEAAIFYHANIRHTCARLGVSSFSSQLFARSRNPRMIPEAIAILVSLLPRFFESYELGGFKDSNSGLDFAVKAFEFSLDGLNHRLGSDYTAKEAEQVFSQYRVKYEKEGEGRYTLLPPMDRTDLLESCDMEEEIFRYYGAERIHPTLDSFPLSQGTLTPAQAGRRKIRELLVDRGFDELLTFTLIDEKMDSSIRVFSQEPSYRIKNPMTKDHEIVRSDLLPSLLSAIDYNVARQHDNLALFEISAVDTPKGDHLYLSLGLRGKKSLSENYGEREYSFFDLKGTVEAILEKLGVKETRYKLVYSKNPAFHPNCSADLYFGKDLVGTFGQIHPSLRKDKVLLGELDLGYLFALKGGNTRFKPFESYPLVRRDLSILDNGISYETIKKTLLRAKETYIQDVLFFDDFLDKATGKRYLGISLLLGKENGTLNDQEINDSLSKAINSLKGELGLSLRGE